MIKFDVANLLVQRVTCRANTADPEVEKRAKLQDRGERRAFAFLASLPSIRTMMAYSCAVDPKAVSRFAMCTRTETQLQGKDVEDMSVV